MEIKRHYRPNRVKKYGARWYVGGRAKTRFFATEDEREQFISNFSKQVASNGTDLLLGFNAAQMRRWQEASRLAPDADPVEAMRFWLASNRTAIKPVKLSGAISAYLKHIRAMERDSAYCTRLSACSGVCLNSSCAEQNVSYSCPSKSFRSVTTTIVGFFISGC